MVNLTTYGLLNLSAGLEELMGNPSWRPTFRVRPLFSFAGFAGCFAVMFMTPDGRPVLCPFGPFLLKKV